MDKNRLQKLGENLKLAERNPVEALFRNGNTVAPSTMR